MAADNAAWLALRREEALEPYLAICDAHHHFFDNAFTRYLLPDLHADTAAGHRVVSTVFVNSTFSYRGSGPEELRPVGETERVRAIADEAATSGCATIDGIVAYADLRLGAAVEPVLRAHADAGGDRFKGIRHAAAWNSDPGIRKHPHAQPGLLDDPTFRAGLRTLGRMGLTFDAWVYHPQLDELTAVARDLPEVTFVVDHYGGPLGIGPYGDRDEVMAGWAPAIERLARCPNVYMKLGGIGFTAFGLRWHHRDLPPSSIDLATAWHDPTRLCIEAFGPRRCMFESNFPVDRTSCSYTVLWNSFKRMTADLAPADRRWLFHDTATEAYGLRSAGPNRPRATTPAPVAGGPGPATGAPTPSRDSSRAEQEQA
jgi:predicted TIM-barrel fold metal-dependent hydrolase